MSEGRDTDADAALYEAEAAVRRSEDDAARIMGEVDEVNLFIEQERAELESGREEREREADLEAALARNGELGRARKVLQERIDREETTWAAVMGNEDQHWSAVEVRGEIVVAMREAIDVLEDEDPAFSAQYRALSTGRDPREGPGEWDSLGPASDAEPPIDPRGGSTSGAQPREESHPGTFPGGPDPRFGQW